LVTPIFTPIMVPVRKREEQDKQRLLQTQSTNLLNSQRGSHDENRCVLLCGSATAVPSTTWDFPEKMRAETRRTHAIRDEGKKELDDGKEPGA
jgi:hypothetical protein